MRNHRILTRELRVALAEKMILDFDYLPLPNLNVTGTAPTNRADAGPANPNRAAQFIRLDTDRDGKLTKAEFGTGRAPADADRWFQQRDTNEDRFISREEFLPQSPLPKPR